MAALLVNIDVPDLERGVAFYGAALGLAVARRLGDGVVELAGAGVPVYLLARPAGSAPAPGAALRDYGRHWTPVHLDLAVEDLEAAVARAVAAGARPEGPVQESPARPERHRSAGDVSSGPARSSCGVRNPAGKIERRGGGSMGDHEIPDTLRDELRAAWQRYVDLLAPLRPDLHRYCRRLTGSLWDAEDLAQDTLLRAFATLGSVHHRIENPRAYLLRVASNTWIDTVRRRGGEVAALAAGLPAPAGPEAAPGAVRDAGATLIQRLAPQERAAIVLKDVFELTLEEIAAVLGTTAGAVKSALHRGRTRLREPEAPAARPAPSLALVERFIAAWRASDLPGLLALVVEDAAVENVGCGVELGREAGGQGFLYKAVHGHPEWPAALQPEAVRVDAGVVEGVPLVLCFATRQGREALEQVLRFDELDGQVARLRAYAFCPETMREVGSALGLPVRTGLYRFPTPAPGKYWESPPAPGGGAPPGASSRAS